MAAAHILVVGGSLGGLMAANLLHRAGHKVTLLEKSAASLDGRGAGIVTHRSLLDALRAAGAVVDDTLGVWVARRVALDLSGAPQAQTAYPQLLTSWSRLYNLLRAALPADCLRAGQELTRFSQRPDGVAVLCSNGQRYQADLLIASDGIRSTVRADLAPAVQPRYAGYAAWRGVCDEALLSACTRETLFEHFGFGLPDGEQIIGYPVAGALNSTRRGERRYNFVWYRPADPAAELPRLLTDASGQHHPAGISPQQVSPSEVARMRADAHRLLAPQWAEVIAKTAAPFLQPIYDLASDRLCFGRAALMGDAAFVARPHVGMGVSKASDDARALVRAIAAHGATPAALQAYETERVAPGLAVVERARRLGSYLEAQIGVAANSSSRPDQRPRRDPLEVLQQTAIDLALPA